MAAPIRTIAVAGGGLDAWFAALALAKRLPGAAVTVVAAPEPPPQPADLYAGTRPGFRRALGKLGIDPLALAAEAGGVARLGQVYGGWSAAGAAFAHGFGRYGTRVGPVPFHQAWLRARAEGEAAPLDLHSAALMLARAGRVTDPSDDEYSPLALFDHGWSFDPPALTEAFRRRAVASGVGVITAGIAAIDRADERIAALRLADGRSVAADLFVDATGPAARLLEPLDPGGRDDWSPWLRANRIAPGRDRAEPGLPLLDAAVMEGGGWRLRAPLRHATLDLALPWSGPDGIGVALPQGRRRRAWVGNCVAVGDAAVTLEPLGAPGLHLLALQLDRILQSLPDRACDPVETGEHNRRVALEVDLVRDFVILHHALAAEAGREPPLEAPLPDALAHTLALFRARGKIPGRDGETAEIDDWLAVLLGHGVVPNEPDPFLDGLPRERFVRTSATIRAMIAEAVRAAPTHAEFLARRA